MVTRWRAFQENYFRASIDCTIIVTSRSIFLCGNFGRHGMRLSNGDEIHVVAEKIFPKRFECAGLWFSHLLPVHRPHMMWVLVSKDQDASFGWLLILATFLTRCRGSPNKDFSNSSTICTGLNDVKTFWRQLLCYLQVPYCRLEYGLLAFAYLNVWYQSYCKYLRIMHTRTSYIIRPIKVHVLLLCR